MIWGIFSTDNSCDIILTFVYFNDLKPHFFFEILSVDSFRDCEDTCLRQFECVQYVFDPPMCVTYREWNTVEIVDGGRGFPLRGVCYQSASPTSAPVQFDLAFQTSSSEYCHFMDCLNEIFLYHNLLFFISQLDYISSIIGIGVFSEVLFHVCLECGTISN